MLEFLVALTGIVGCGSYFAQSWKIIKRKSAADVSLLMYVMLSPGMVVWLVYGIHIKSLPIIVTDITGITSIISVFVVSWIYRDKMG